MPDLPVNPTDLTIVVLIVLSGLFAMARGFVREVLSLASWVGAALVTLWGYGYALPYAKRLIEHQLLAQVVTGVTIFIVSLIVFSMIGGGIASLVRGTTLNALDRALGFAFGLVRGALIIAVMWLGLAWAIPAGEHPKWLRGAKLLPAVERLAEYLRNLAPPEFRARAITAGNQVNDGARQVDQFRQILHAPSTPQAKNPASPGETGYKTDERRGLDGLFQRAEPAAPTSR
jgi:membrane protein required for colicin V production